MLLHNSKSGASPKVSTGDVELSYPWISHCLGPVPKNKNENLAKGPKLCMPSMNHEQFPPRVGQDRKDDQEICKASI
ncbi:hypothetical protein A4A49_24196 [Nicotiana attenuata]|uniref:Uncharacterized protein n=1 Tax=Nicotiana attenuata TaxID=49451 RepID=A0A1J6I571_NICAT|nr:hypothetical protein A4A49_24196 [Nicotiana attenuata]